MMTRSTGTPIVPAVAVSRQTIASVQANLDNYEYENDQRHLKVCDRVTVLEQEVARLCEEKMGRPTLPSIQDFKVFIASKLYWLFMIALICYSGYHLLNSPTITNFFSNSNVTIDREGNTIVNPLTATIEEVTRANAHLLTGDTHKLVNDLEQLATTIDNSFSPVNELRPILQHEAQLFTQTVGEVFLRELRAGKSPSELVRGIIAGIGR